MKKLILLTFLMSTQAYSLNFSNLNEEVCQKTEEVRGYINSIGNLDGVFSGVSGPGSVFSFMKADNIIVEYCSYVAEMKGLETTEDILDKAEKLNKITDSGFTDEINLTRNTFDLANSVYDFEENEFNSSQILTPRMTRKLNRYYKDVGQYYNENMADSADDMIDVRSRRQRENDISRLAKIARRRAIIEEATNCGDRSKLRSNVNYQKIYDSQLKPKYNELDESEYIISFHHRMIERMSPKLVSNEAEMEEFLVEFSNLTLNSYKLTYNVATDTRGSTEKVDNPNYDPEKRDIEENTKYIVKDKNITFKYQNYTIIENPKLKKSFKEKWGSRWRAYVTIEVLSSSRGIFNKPRQRVESKIYGYGINCSYYKIARKKNLSRNDPAYRIKLKRYKKECDDAEAKKTSDAGGLLSLHIEEYLKALRIKRNAEKEIYTIESRYLDIHRRIETKDGQVEDFGPSYKREEITCSDSPSPALMAKQSQELTKVNAQLNQVIAENTHLQNSLLEKIIIEQEKDKNERERKRILEAKEATRKEMTIKMARPLSSAP